MNTPNGEDKDLINIQYKLAIEARDKLNENFHKWMLFYYVSITAVLASTITQSKPEFHIWISLVGAFLCILWNLTCKGYYYWSKSWIEIIIRLEHKLIECHPEFGVYSVFSKKVADDESGVFSLTKPANISTPKLIQIFSFVSIIAWLLFAGYRFFNSGECICSNPMKIFIALFVVIAYGFLYKFLPKYVTSRGDDTHTLV